MIRIIPFCFKQICCTEWPKGMIAYRCPPITVCDVEDLAVEGDVDVEVEVLPVPVIALVVLGQPHALDELALRHAAVLHVGFDDGDAVIFQVVVEDDGSDAEVLAGRLMDCLLVESIEFQYLEWKSYARMPSMIKLS